MLRLFHHFGGRFNRSQKFTRCFTTETQTNFDDLDRDKKIKIFEMEIEVNYLISEEDFVI